MDTLMGFHAIGDVVAGRKLPAVRVNRIYVRDAPPRRPLRRLLVVRRYQAATSIFSIDTGRGGRVAAGGRGRGADR